jgi:hypothetical protein
MPGFDSGQGRENYSLLHSIQTFSGDHTASYPMGTGDLSPGVKWPENEAEHSAPFNAEVKNGGAIPPLPRTFLWHGAQLIKHRDNTHRSYMKIAYSLDPCFIKHLFNDILVSRKIYMPKSFLNPGFCFSDVRISLRDVASSVHFRYS